MGPERETPQKRSNEQAIDGLMDSEGAGDAFWIKKKKGSSGVSESFKNYDGMLAFRGTNEKPFEGGATNVLVGEEGGLRRFEGRARDHEA